MKRLIKFLLPLLLICTPVAAYWQSRLQVNIASSAYSPPLDGVGTLLRAYSTWRLTTAYNSNLIRVIRISDSNTVDYPAQSNGTVDWSAIATQCTTATACRMFFYDQSGNGSNTSVGAGDVVIDPTNKWASTNNGTNWLAFTPAVQAQPYVMVYNYNQISCNSSDCRLAADTPSNFSIWSTGANVGIYSGNFTSLVTKTANTWGVVWALFSGASSVINLNGSSTTGLSAGTQALAVNQHGLGTNPGSTSFYRSNMLFDTFVIFSGDPGATALNTFSTWLQTNAAH